MPITATRFLFSYRRTGFGARRSVLPLAGLRALRQWLRGIHPDAIGAEVTDLRLNPFVFVAGTCR